MGHQPLAPFSTAPRPTSRLSAIAQRLLVLAVLSTLFLWNSPETLDRGLEIYDTVKWSMTLLSTDPARRAKQLIRRYPIIGQSPASSPPAPPDPHFDVDGHIDLPILARGFYLNQLKEIDLERKVKGQVDIPRLRAGGVGGFFWSVYVACPIDTGVNEGRNFTTSSWRVRDTLEQIDIAKLLVEKFSKTFELVRDAASWRRLMRRGKIVGMLGVEGGHQIGSSLSLLRVYYELGARYVTLTHTCHNALADSCGAQGVDIGVRWNGLSDFGRLAVREMNRLGLMVDISHTHPKTASDVLTHSLAPPIFSHSNARGIHQVVRNIPDSILRRIGRLSSPHRSHNLTEDGEGGLGWGNDTKEVERRIPAGDTIIMLNFLPDFVSEYPDGSGIPASYREVAEHADYIGRLAGREHVGLGSDFDGIDHGPVGLEDVSKYHNLIEELIKRGWSDGEIKGLNGGNLLRILERVERVQKGLRGVEVDTTIFEGREDMVYWKGG